LPQHRYAVDGAFPAGQGTALAHPVWAHPFYPRSHTPACSVRRPRSSFAMNAAFRRRLGPIKTPQINLQRSDIIGARHPGVLFEKPVHRTSPPPQAGARTSVVAQSSMKTTAPFAPRPQPIRTTCVAASGRDANPNPRGASDVRRQKKQTQRQRDAMPAMWN